MSDTVRFESTEKRSVAGTTELEKNVDPKIPGLQLIAKKEETSTAIVWRALQLSLDREVTVWMMNEEFAHKSAQVEHFETVSRAVARIRHPNLLQVIDVARTPEGTPYVVFENVEGSTLAALLRMERKIDPSRALRIGIEIAKALDFAWKQCGFVHRNIKPETIIIEPGDVVKLTNFSSATLVKPGENPLAYDEELVVGTPNYASPEQIECLRTIDYHSDMYSTGALLYRLITGITPFGTEEDPMVVFDHQRIGTLENPRDLDPNVKPSVVHILQKMMAKAPEDRYKWWQDVIEDMHRVLEGRPPYIESGGYVPPLSTIARSLAEETPGTQPKRPSKARVKISRPDPANVRLSSTTVSTKKSGAGPGVFVKLFAVFLIVGFCFWLTRVRIRNLEGRVADAVPEEFVLPLEEAVTGIENEIYSFPESLGESQEVVEENSALGSDFEDEESVGGVPNLAQVLSPEETAPQSDDGDADDAVASSPEMSQAVLVETLYNNVLEYSLAEARQLARTLFQETKQTSGLDEEECKLIWRAFSEASSYEDLVGVFLSGSPGKRTLTVAGEEVAFTPRSYANGELTGMLHLKDGTSKTGHRIKLSDMSAEEMYDCLQASVVDTNPSALYARAFLTMKMKDRGAFSILLKKYTIKELEPFLEHVGK